MPISLLDALRIPLSTRLDRSGFAQRRLKIGRAARSFGRVSRAGFTVAREAEGGTTEFLHVQPGREAYAVTAFVGWCPDDTIPWGESALDWPAAERTEQQRDRYCCPLFTLFERDGVRAHARRLEGDGWWLVSPGAVPLGVNDDALAQGIFATMKAQQESASALAHGIGSRDADALAQRMEQDIRRLALTYLTARLHHRLRRDP